MNSSLANTFSHMAGSFFILLVFSLVDQKTLVHLHNGILHSRMKEGAPTLCNSMDGSGEHYAK